MSAPSVYVAAAASVTDPGAVQRDAPELWREVRRYNLPVQLALAAAERAAVSARDIASAAIVSVAPFRSGSAELWAWARDHSTRDDLSRARLNPTHTLHVVDNLALSAFALAHGNHGYCLGLGGAPGQAWCGVEAVLARLQAGHEEEAILVAGDHDDASDRTALGVALLFSVRRAACAPLGRTVRLAALRRTPAAGGERGRELEPHSAAGLHALLGAIASAPGGRLRYAVPTRHADGIDKVELDVEIDEHAESQHDDAA